MPHNGDVNMAAARAFYGTPARRAKWYNYTMGCSLLCKGFNELWTLALNNQAELGFTHFAMLHSDIVPEDGWLDLLVDEQQRTGADVVSCVSPLKSGEGLTSTAIDGDGEWNLSRRLTMREVMKLPETFGVEDCGVPDCSPSSPHWNPNRRLLVNTGCWIADLSKPWVRQFHFRTEDRIVVGHADEQDLRTSLEVLDGRLQAIVIGPRGSELADQGALTGEQGRGVQRALGGTAEYSEDGGPELLGVLGEVELPYIDAWRNVGHISILVGVAKGVRPYWAP
jgi:hypothetical protein